jgi:hypothetical protein
MHKILSFDEVINSLSFVVVFVLYVNVVTHNFY